MFLALSLTLALLNRGTPGGGGHGLFGNLPAAPAGLPAGARDPRRPRRHRTPAAAARAAGPDPLIPLTGA